MGNTISTKLYKTTHKLLMDIQEKLPGKPSTVSLLDEAVKLLAEKHLKESS